MCVCWYLKSASSFDSPNMMICAACCKEHSTRAEWRTDHLGLSWSHPLIVLDWLWAVPSNAHINTGHDLHITVGSNLMTPVGPVQVLFSLPTSVAPTGQNSLQPSYSTTKSFLIRALTRLTTRQLAQGTPSCHNSEGTCAKWGLTSHPRPQSRASKT